MSKGYNWAIIKAEYETGKYSMRELSKKHGFNESYARRKSNKNNWVKGKTNKKVTQAAAKRVLDRIGKNEADIKQELYNTLIMIESKMNQEWGNIEPDFGTLKSTKISTEILQNIMDMKYELLDIQKVAKRVEEKLDINSVDGVNIKIVDE